MIWGAIILAAAVFAADASSDVAPVMAGETAPFDGLLVPEGRFASLLRAEIRVGELTAVVEVERGYAKAVESVYKRALAEADPWWRSPWFVGSVAFVAGVAAAILSVYVGVQIVEATH